MTKVHLIKFLPGIAWFFIVILLTCLPGDDIPTVGWLNDIYFDKWVHAGMFGGLVFLFSFPFFRIKIPDAKKIYYIFCITLAAIFWGLAIEFIQKYFIPGRSFDLLDWAADTGGAMASFWFVRTNLLNSSMGKRRR